MTCISPKSNRKVPDDTDTMLQDSQVLFCQKSTLSVHLINIKIRPCHITSAFSQLKWLWLMWGNSMMSWVANNMKKCVFPKIWKFF